MQIKFKLLVEGAQLPSRKHANDVGLDVYAPTEGILYPGANKIDLGFSVDVPIGYQANIYPRSGHAAKGILAQIPPIDPGYTGHIHAILINASQEPYTYDKGERLGQLVFTPVSIVQPTLAYESARGDAGFNSTGR